MTDLETVRELYTRAGVVFDSGRVTNDTDPRAFQFGATCYLEFHGQRGPTNLGYHYSSATMYFDADGRLVAVAAEEG